MKRRAIFRRLSAAAILWLAIVQLAPQGLQGQQAPEDEWKACVRRPAALVWSQGKIWVANQRSGTISIVDPDLARVVDEINVGQSLVDLQLSLDGRRLWAIDYLGAELIGFEIGEATWNLYTRQPLPPFPISLALSPDGKRLSVACLWPRKLLLMEVNETGTLTQAPELELPFAPREQLYLSDQRLLVADAFAGRVLVVDVSQPSIVAQHDSAGQNIRGLALAPRGKRVRLTMQRMDSSRPTTHEEIFWGGVLQNLTIEVVAADLQKDDVDWYQQNQHLGFPSFGAGDPDSIVYTEDGRTLIALAGVHQLAIRPAPNQLVKQLPVGRRPVDIAWDQLGQRAMVACQMDDSIAIVDVQNLKVTAQIPLGPRAELSLADRGEALFYDATLSLDGWYSCHSCHPDGHTTGLLNDNFGDDSIGAPKRIHSLLGTADTGPWAWNGNMASLEQQVHKSLQQTMQSDSTADDVVNALAEFLRTLSPPPRGELCFTLDPGAVERGARVFQKQNCAACHAGAQLTATDRYDVGIHDQAGNMKFNPPSLRGVVHRHAFYHDNSVTSFKQLFERFGHPNQKTLDAGEIADLVEYLRSL